MNTKPASIFASAENDLLDMPATAARPTPEQVRAVAQDTNFRSREAAPSAPVRAVPWRYRTGRDVQFNVKVSQATREGFEALAMRLNRPKGELVERALAALERELAGQG